MQSTAIHETETIITDSLLSHIDALKLDGWRLVQILCVALSGNTGYELTYTFGGDLALLSYRLNIGIKDAIPSITSLYPAAFLYENEIRDLFGVRIERIEADWLGCVYGDMIDTPFRKKTITPTSSESAKGLNGGLKL